MLVQYIISPTMSTEASGAQEAASSSKSPVVVLAYSGGLDTSCILVWLREQGYSVVAFLANLGQDEDFIAAEAKARKLGAVDVIVSDLRHSLVSHFVFPFVSAGSPYEGRYLLGTALARPCIVQGLVAAARQHRAGYIAHGATGKGNDQVRFEFGCAALMPEVKVLAPWRDSSFCARFCGRQDLFEYAQQHGIPLPVTPKQPWSIDANIIHVSYESGILEDPSTPAPKGLCQMTVDPEEAPDAPQLLTIHFQRGVPVTVLTEGADGPAVSGSLEVFSAVNAAAAAHGVGRLDIVENRFLGLKSRGVYETPGLTTLCAAHKDLESVCQDSQLAKVKAGLAQTLADQIYNGLWFSPECEYTRECIAASQRHVSGEVTVKLYKGSVSVVSRRGAEGCSLYNTGLVSMDQHGDFDPSDATGFIAIHALRLREFWRNRQSNPTQEGM